MLFLMFGMANGNVPLERKMRPATIFTKAEEKELATSKQAKCLQSWSAKRATHQLSTVFMNLQSSVIHILISPKKIFLSEEEATTALEELTKMYKNDFGSSVEVKAEIKLWQILLSKMYAAMDAKTKIIKMTELMQRCNADLYPNVYKLLKIFCCLPISNVYTERSFT